MIGFGGVVLGAHDEGAAAAGEKCEWRDGVVLRSTLACGWLPILAFLAQPASADWRRIIAGDDGEWTTDTPAPQRLTYFTERQLARECACATDAEKASRARADVRIVGQIRGFAISDVSYSCGCYGIEVPAAHSTIVKTGPDRYQEVFYAGIVGAGGSTLVKASEQQNLLWMRIDYGGSNHAVGDWGLWFGKEGPTILDMRELWKAVQKLMQSTPLAKDALVMTWNATIEAKRSSFVFRVPLRDWSQEESPFVEVEFRIDRDRIAIIRKSFHASAKED
jgi:hypothetical protein